MQTKRCECLRIHYEWSKSAMQDSLANKSDPAKHWQGVSLRMRCVVVSFVRRSQPFAKFARAFVSILNIRKGFTRNSENVLLSFVRNSQGFVRNSRAFVTICKASLVSVVLLVNRIMFGEFAAKIKFWHSQVYSPMCESSIRSWNR